MRSILSFITSLIVLIPAVGQGQWEVVNEGTIYDFQSVDFINSDTGWIAGNSGIYLTMDGSKNWELLNSDFKFRVIDFYNEWIGWAIVRGIL